ncbi:Probable RNA-directed DNA polymerase from transposon X-element [Eumeta japonica]|uniref:Probable RNA-directed DNA polymerase from transposon X-element n=1 Tax=Eumeta variegata TaxID=151549 RepID=A0A4C1WR38_EUMVA|nr:Probable RNA-directed DNA polymerase from transposon X-element [Eumeta japonica]
MTAGIPAGITPGMPPALRPPGIPASVPRLQTDAGLPPTGPLLGFPPSMPPQSLPQPGMVGGFLSGLMGLGGLLPGMPPLHLHHPGPHAAPATAAPSAPAQVQSGQPQGEAVTRTDDAMDLDLEDNQPEESVTDSNTNTGALPPPLALPDQLQALLSKPPPSFNAAEPPPNFNEPPPFNVNQPPPVDESKENSTLAQSDEKRGDRDRDKDRDRRDRDRDRDRRDRDRRDRDRDRRDRDRGRERDRVFNGIFRTGHFSDAWKRSKIFTIPKAGKDPRNPSNLHPIILLSYETKTFERALLRRLYSFMSPRQEQYGFHTGYSTTLLLIWVLHHLASEMNCGRYTVAVLLDTKKAFDKVWHDGLL